MNFIFPQNYNFKNKILGFLDYSTLFLIIFWIIFIVLLLSILPFSLNIKVFIFIILVFPIILISFSGFNGESVTYVLFYLFKFIFKQKIFFYLKSSS